MILLPYINRGQKAFHNYNFDDNDRYRKGRIKAEMNLGQICRSTYMICYSSWIPSPMLAP